MIASVFDRGLRMSSSLRHQITREQDEGKVLHEEYILLDFIFDSPDCATVVKVWSKFFEPVDVEAAQKLLAENPTGVLKDEVSAIAPPFRPGPSDGKAGPATTHQRARLTLVPRKPADVPHD